MTTSTPADAVRAAIDALRHSTDEEAAAVAIEAAAGSLLPLPAADDRSPQADRDRLLRLQFLALADELAGNRPPAASREALAEAREESQAVQSLAEFAAADIPPGPYSEHDLREQWNAQAADGEDWDSLESCEQLAWAQARAIAADRGRTAQAAETTPARLRHCPTHGQQGPEAWGCPECLRELRADMATTREALRRLVVWGGFAPFRHGSQGFDRETVLAVADWFADGMTAPLPPLPPYIASREGLEPTTSAPTLPPALVLDGGDGVRIEATNHERTSWVVRDSYWCLNSNREWESDYSHLHDDADFLARSRWPSAEAAWAALLEYRAGEGVQS